MDNETYILKLSSSLSRSTYSFHLEEIYFTANISYKHFTLRFQPQAKHVEQEINHRFFVVLPFALVILYMIYNHELMSPLLSSLIAILQLALSSRSKPSDAQTSKLFPTVSTTATSDQMQDSRDFTGTDSLKKKIKSKKIQ